MTNKIVLCILGLMLVLSFAAISWSEDISIISMPAGECTLSIEANDQWNTLRLRALHPQYHNCRITQDEMISVLTKAFSKTDAPRLSQSYNSLSIGRLIDFPWLCQHLAIAAYEDKAWNAKKGKPVSMDINAYVERILFNRQLLAKIESALSQGGYSIVGVSVEKVLVGSFRDVPLYQGEIKPGKVPFDAQVWFRLKKN